MSHTERSFWSGQRVLVTGGAGFLGSYVVEGLRARGSDHIMAPRKAEHDLRDVDVVRRLYSSWRPTMVIHLAAVVGGIAANRERPGEFFYDNLIMGAQLFDQARRSGVEKFVAVGTICAYPKLTPVPFREETLWDGYPEETNAPYGLAKKMLLVQSQAYRQQYGYNSIFLLPVNLYGPGVKDLAETILRHTEVNATIRWDATPPNGQPRRRLDTSRAKQEFGFAAKVGFEEGLRRTVDWYRHVRDETGSRSVQTGASP